MLKCFRHIGGHDVREEQGAEKVPGLSTVQGTIVYKDYGVVSGVTDRSIEEADDEDEEEKVDFCCLSGCLTMISVGILVFLALPAGILLCTYASSNDDMEVLVVGIVLAVSPLISFPLIALILYNRRRIATLRERKVSSSSASSKTQNAASHAIRY